MPHCFHVLMVNVDNTHYYGSSLQYLLSIIIITSVMLSSVAISTVITSIIICALGVVLCCLLFHLNHVGDM